MILVNNYVLVKFYGICPFLGVSKKLDSAVGMSGAVIFVMFMATAVTFPIQIFILDKAGLSYLQTIVFILVIAVLVQFIEIFQMCIRDSPLRYVCEMVCDRVAASQIYLGDKYTDASAWEYYQRSKDHYLMHPETRALLEKLLCMVRDLGRERTFAYMKFLLGCENDY